MNFGNPFHDANVFILRISTGTKYLFDLRNKTSNPANFVIPRSITFKINVLASVGVLSVNC